MSDFVVVHGTNSGAQWHQRQGEQPCEPCRIARAEYQREWRERHPRVMRKQRQKAALVDRARRILADRYRYEYLRILDEVTREAQGEDAPAVDRSVAF